MVKRHKRSRSNHHNHHALRLRKPLKYMANHPVKSIGATMLASVATGLAIVYFTRR